MKKHITALLALTILLCSCSSGKTLQEIKETTAETTTIQTESETTTQTTTETATETEEEEEKPILDMDFCILDGINFGMTADEAIEVLGEPDMELHFDGKIMIKYGESGLTFGDYSRMVNAAFVKQRADLAMDEDDGSDKAKTDELYLTAILIQDHTLDDRLYGGISLGATAEEATEAYFIDQEMFIPFKYKRLQKAGELKVLYGIDDIDMGIPGPEDNDFHSMGFIKYKTDNDFGAVMYQAYEGDMVNSITYEIDNDEKIIGIVAALTKYR